MDVIADHIKLYVYHMHLWVALPVTGGPVPSVSPAELAGKLGGFAGLLFQLPPNSKATPNPRLEGIEQPSSRFIRAHTPVLEGGFFVGTINAGGLLALGADFRNSCFLVASQCRATSSGVVRGKKLADFQDGRCTRLSASDNTGLCKRCAERAKKPSPEATMIHRYPLPDRKRRNVDIPCGIIDLAPWAPNGPMEPDDVFRRIINDLKETVEGAKRICLGGHAVCGSPLPGLDEVNAEEVPTDDDDEFGMRTDELFRSFRRN